MNIIKNKLSEILLIILLCIFILAIAYIAIKFRLQITSALREYKHFINQFGFYAPLVYIGLFIISIIILFPPAGFTVYTLLSGLMFGWTQGIIYSYIASVVGAALAFLIAHHYAPRWIVKYVSVKFDKIITHIHSDRWYLVAILRLVPLVPMHLQNYLFGLTRIKYTSFILTTAIFIFPKIAINNYIGSLSENVLLQQGVLLTQESIILYGCVLALLLIVVIKKTNEYLFHKKNK